MLKEDESVSDNLTEEQERTLNALLNLIIPPSEDGKMPGAADVGFFDHMDSHEIRPWIQEGLLHVVEESQATYGKELSALNGAEQGQLIDSLRGRFRQFFNGLTTQVINCYYQHDDVLEAIGLEARPPFPNGYPVEEGDLALLEPVFLRGKIYRD